MSAGKMNDAMIINIPSLARMEKGFLGDDLQRCRDANVQMVCIPQSVIYELTNVTLNGYNNEQDIIHHTLFNQNILDKLTKDLETIENTSRDASAQLTRLLKLSRDEYSNYTTLFASSQLVSTYPDISAFAAVTLPRSVEEKLSYEQRNALKELNALYNGIQAEKKEDNKEALKRSKETLESYKKQIEQLSVKISELETEKVSLQTKLILEQGKAISELRANPAHVLDGDEILRNHWDNVLAEKFDGGGYYDD